MSSRLGMWFDNVSDDVVDTALLVCLGFALGEPWLSLSLVAAALRGFASWVIFAGAARQGHPGDVMAFRWWFETDQATVEVYEDLTPLTLVRSLGRRDTYVTIFAICFFVGFPLGAFLLAASNAAMHGGLALLHIVFSRR